MTCDAYTCAKRAVFRTQRADRLSAEVRQWCETHAKIKVTKYPLISARKEKVGKYALVVSRVGGKG